MVDVTYFNETLEDEITYVSAFLDQSTYINQDGKSDREGVEITGRWAATDTLTLAANYTYLDASNPDGSVETRRPMHELGLSATSSFMNGRARGTVDIRHVSGNYDTQFWGAYETVELDSYTTVNLAATYDLTDNVMLNGRITNVFDTDTMDVWGYEGQGRQAYIGLAAKW